MPWKTREFTNVAHAQAFVKQLTRKGLSPGEDIKTKTQDGKYTVEYYESGFGIFGA